MPIDSTASALDHTDTALLRDADDAILAGYAMRRSAGVIDSADDRPVFAVGEPPGATAVDRAVHAAVSEGTSPSPQPSESDGGDSD